jgi:LysM repeat protein
MKTCGADGMKNLTAALVATSLLTLISVDRAQAQAPTSLAGSRTSIEYQHTHATVHGYGFAQSSQDVTELVRTGQLVRITANRHFVIHNVSYPYLKPAVKTLLERLSAQYHNACGEQLTVTSMTRPVARQPANAHNNSVHPTGMAFDLRIPSNQRCRSWLERTLLALEDYNVLDVTRERNPPHYHVAVFPEPYTRYLAGVGGQQREYVVRQGDTLSSVASRNGVSVAQLRSVNGLRGDLIRVGQTLTVPAAGSTGTTLASNTTNSAPQQPVRRELTHQVQRGETLWRIANRYRTSVDALRTENGLADDLLRVGQMLLIVLDES